VDESSRWVDEMCFIQGVLKPSYSVPLQHKRQAINCYVREENNNKKLGHHKGWPCLSESAGA
jgi:hypothetical protein